MIRFETEKSLQEFLLANYEKIDGLDFDEFIASEVNIGNYGRVDLMSWGFHCHNVKEREITLNISLYELKNYKSSYKELSQLCRYMTGLRELSNDIDGKEIKIDINGYLVCPDIDLNDDFTLLYNFLKENIYICTFDMDPLDGIQFIYERKQYTMKEQKLPEIEELIPDFNDQKNDFIKAINREVDRTIELENFNAEE